MLAEKQRAVSWPQPSIQSTAMLAVHGPGGGGGDGSGAAKNAKVLPAVYSPLTDMLLAFLFWIYCYLGSNEHTVAIPQGKMQEQRIKVQSSLQGTIVAPAIQIPNHERVPSYKSWSYLMENELANEVGVRIFYTDPTGGACSHLEPLFALVVRVSLRMPHLCDNWSRAGETIPASDSEDEDRKGEGNLEGAHRERAEWVMLQLAAEHGVIPEMVQALADRLDAAPCESPSAAALLVSTTFHQLLSSGAPVLAFLPVL